MVDREISYDRNERLKKDSSDAKDTKNARVHMTLTTAAEDLTEVILKMSLGWRQQDQQWRCLDTGGVHWWSRSSYSGIRVKQLYRSILEVVQERGSLWWLVEDYSKTFFFFSYAKYMK